MNLNEAIKTLKNNGYIVEGFNDDAKHALFHAPEKKTIFPTETGRFTQLCNEWQPLGDDYGPLRDEYNKNYYRDAESDIYLIRYEDDEISAELYRIEHGQEVFIGTIPNVEDEDFKLALDGQRIGIEIDPYHYT